MNNEFLSATNCLELSLHQCGREKCISSKYISFNPLPYHILHYVVSGKGHLKVDGKKYILGKNNLFLVKANTSLDYYPDKDDPWTYMWIGFDGTMANIYLNMMGFNEQTQVIKITDGVEVRNLFEQLIAHYQDFAMLDIKCLGLAYQLMFELINKNMIEKKEHLSFVHTHILNAKQYIYNNYQFAISVNDIASNVGVSPNYLANIFQEYEHMTTKQFLIKVRMENAKSLLLTNKYKIKEIAKNVGYANQLYFSNEFKKYYGVYPTEMKKH